MKKLLSILLASVITVCLISLNTKQTKAETEPNGTFTIESGAWSASVSGQTNYPYNFEKDDVIKIVNNSGSQIDVNFPGFESNSTICLPSGQSHTYTVEYSVTIESGDLTTYVNIYEGMIKNAVQFRYFLQSTGTRKCKLASDPIYLFDNGISVNGTKTLDLNGKTIKAYEDDEETFKGEMFSIGEGDSLIIKDSTQDSNNPYGLGVIDGTYTGEGSHDDNVKGFKIYRNGKLTIEAGTIKNMCALNKTNYSAEKMYGGAIFNIGNLEIKNAKIVDCKAVKGGAIYNTNSNNDVTSTLTNVLIENCEATDSGGAIYSRDNGDTVVTTLTGNTIIKNCEATYGGAICSDLYSGVNKLIIENGTIQNCEATYGGAICSNGGYNELKNGKIKDCKSDYSAISLLPDNKNRTNNSELCLNGTFVFDNSNKSNIEDDICLTYGAKIVLGSNFVPSQTDPIKVWYDLRDLGAGVEKTDVVTCNGYTLGAGQKLKDLFVSINGQEYLTEDADPSLSFKSVQITTQPTWPEYKIKTDNDVNITGISATYQWYQQDILEEIQVEEAKEYEGDKYLDFTISTDGCYGVYDSTKKTWKNPSTRQNYYIFNIEDLKEGETISFDYNADNSTVFVGIAIYDENSSYSTIETTQINGSYKAVVPHDGTYSLCLYTMNSSYYYTDIEIKNILVTHLDSLKKIVGETTTALTKPSADANLFCRVAFKNASGYTSYEDSSTLNYGKVLEGNNQNINVGTKKDVTIKFDATTSEYSYLTGSGAVYLDGTESTDILTSGTDYTVTSGSIVLTLKDELISSLNVGSHTIYVKKSSDSGKECSVATLNIVNPSNTTKTSVYKDESCEKVIGPTWHWNNTKGVCEEYTAVKTVTR